MRAFRKRVPCVLVVVGLLMMGWGLVLDAQEPPKPSQLVVSTWGFNTELLEENLAKAFEAETGIRVVFDFGDNSPRLVRLIANRDAPVVDVVTFAPNFAAQALSAGVLQPINTVNISNLADIVEWAQDPLGGHYGIGYTVQILKLAYRTDKIAPPVTSWRDFFRPELAGRITIPDLNTTYGPATLFSTAKAWGGSLDNLETGWQKLGELIESGALLTAYRRSSEAISLFEQDEIWLCPIPSFSWPSLAALNLPLAWVRPASDYWEGMVASLNTLSVVKGTPNAYWAEKFIDFWLSVETQTQMALDKVDAPANTKVVLPDDLRMSFGLDEDISTAVFYDPAFVVANLEEWLDRWNEMIAQ